MMKVRGSFKMSFKSHAEKELALSGLGPDCTDINKMMRDHILKMIEVFADEGHSGFSASYAVSILEKLLRFEPITPLTGDDDEWMEVHNGTYQNNRCGRVFKDENGNAYDIEGRVFYDEYIDEDGETRKSHFTCFESRTPVTFPYTPKTEYLHENDRKNYHTEPDPE
jgi:hypothetical protein